MEEFVMQGKMDQVQTTGAQLFDLSRASGANIEVTGESIILNGYACEVGITSKQFMEMSGLKPGDIFTISYAFEGTVTGSTGGAKFLGVKSLTIVNGGTTGNLKSTITLPEDFGSGEYGKLYFYGNGGGKPCVAKKIMVNSGSSAKPYEPYTGGNPSPSPDYSQPIVTTPQGVITVDFTDGTNHQIVELNCPREFTKWDKLQKIDGVWNWVFGSKRILLTENEQWNYTNKNENIYFSIILNDSYGGKQSSLCRGFKNVDLAYDIRLKDESGIYCDHPAVGMDHKYFRRPNETIQTLEQWKTWLTENPIEILYKTKEPELIPLSPSEQDKLNAIIMYAPNTEITNTGGCNMELTYTVDTKAYVDAKIAPVVKTILETQKALL